MDFSKSIEMLLSAIAGTLISAGIAKAYIAKSLRDLETALTMCHAINERLAAIHVRIESLDDFKRMVTDHDRKLISLEAKKHGRKIAYNRISGKRVRQRTS